jgi:hypothetical protein
VILTSDLIYLGASPPYSLKITRSAGTKTYRHLLELGKKGGLFLDIGCCCEHDSLFVLICLSDPSGFSVGTDARKAVADGFPVKQVILSDLREGTLSSSYIRTLLSPV